MKVIKYSSELSRVAVSSTGTTTSCGCITVLTLQLPSKFNLIDATGNSGSIISCTWLATVRSLFTKIDSSLLISSLGQISVVRDLLYQLTIVDPLLIDVK